MEGADASGDDMMMMTQQWIQSLDLTNYDDSTGYWDFTPSMYDECTNRRSEVVVECMASGLEQGCLAGGDQCVTDLDCCDQMFCGPISGNCTDPVKCFRTLNSKVTFFTVFFRTIQAMASKRSLYSGCTSNVCLYLCSAILWRVTIALFWI